MPVAQRHNHSCCERFSSLPTVWDKLEIKGESCVAANQSCVFTAWKTGSMYLLSTSGRVWEYVEVLENEKPSGATVVHGIFKHV